MKLFKYREDSLYNLSAFTFLSIAYISGWILCFSDNWINNVVGVLLLTQSMVIMTFFVHEFAHGSIFLSKEWNNYAGKLFIWLVLHGFFSFQKIQKLHLEHHSNRADVTYSNFHEYFEQHLVQKRILISLEWCYIPAVELLIKWESLVRLWKNQEESDRKLILFALQFYGVLFVLIAWVHVWTLLCVTVTYIFLLHILRFMDMHQHTYTTYTLDEYGNKPKLPVFDKVYEQDNTYTNLFSSHYTWLNLLTLNFGYHNAHHAKPSIPWCRLPLLHRELNYEVKELPVLALLTNYHGYRVQRVAQSYVGKPNIKAEPSLRVKNFIGIIGGSFLNP